MDVAIDKNTRWPLVRLGDVCEIDRKIGNYELPYIGLEDIESNTAKHIGSLFPRKVLSTTFQFDTTHVLFGRLRPYLNKVLIAPFDGHCSTEIFPLKPHNVLLQKYLLYWLMSADVNANINATSTGTRMPRANMEAVLEILIPLPPLAEQQRIVARLDAAFAAIAEANAAAEANLRNARALFDSYLDQVFSTRGAGWVERRLGDVALEFGRGKSKHRPRNAPELFGGNYPFIQTGDVRNSSRFITEFTQTYNEKGLRQTIPTPI